VKTVLPSFSQDPEQLSVRAIVSPVEGRRKSCQRDTLFGLRSIFPDADIITGYRFVEGQTEGELISHRAAAVIPAPFSLRSSLWPSDSPVEVVVVK
jgi:hypothetical protein